MMNARWPADMMQSSAKSCMQQRFQMLRRAAATRAALQSAGSGSHDVKQAGFYGRQLE